MIKREFQVTDRKLHREKRKKKERKIPCLKCEKSFYSRDKVANRICQTCQYANSKEALHYTYNI